MENQKDPEDREIKKIQRIDQKDGDNRAMAKAHSYGQKILKSIAHKKRSQRVG